MVGITYSLTSIICSLVVCLLQNIFKVQYLTVVTSVQVFENRIFFRYMFTIDVFTFSASDADLTLYLSRYLALLTAIQSELHYQCPPTRLVMMRTSFFHLVFLRSFSIKTSYLTTRSISFEDYNTFLVDISGYLSMSIVTKNYALFRDVPVIWVNLAGNLILHRFLKQIAMNICFAIICICRYLSHLNLGHYYLPKVFSMKWLNSLKGLCKECILIVLTMTLIVTRASVKPWHSKYY